MTGDLKGGIPYPILISGASGMLGWDLTRSFGAAIGPERVIALGHRFLDITQPDSIAAALRQYRPKILINAAAYTNVDGAESEKEAARAINADGPRELSRACAAHGIRLVHFSTDQVFDGQADWPRREDEPTGPINNYAQTKLMGEQEVLQCPGALVLRVQWLYGERKDRFTPLRQKEVFTPFSDQYGSPTWTRLLAETLLEMLDRDLSGLFHFAHDDHASWLEVFQFVKSELGLAVRLEPRRTSEVTLPAKRPLFSVLSNRKLCQALGRSGLGTWKDPLRQFLGVVPR
jgi:dTDP-4-dehydrorhamnose reductase